MLVLHVLHGLDPQSGGPFEALREMVEFQQMAGISVRVLGTDAQFGGKNLPMEDLRIELEKFAPFAGETLTLLHSKGISKREQKQLRQLIDQLWPAGRPSGKKRNQ